MKTQSAHVAMNGGTDLQVGIGSAHCVTRIVHEFEIVAIGEVTQCRPIAGMSCHIHANNPAHPMAGRTQSLCVLLDLVWINGQTLFVNVDEIWLCAHISAAV